MIIGIGGKIGSGKSTLIEEFLKTNRGINYLDLDKFVKNVIFNCEEFKNYLEGELNYKFENIDDFILVITESFQTFEKYTLFIWDLIQKKINDHINLQENWIIEGAVINILKLSFNKTIYIDCENFIEQTIHRKPISPKLLSYIIRIQEKYIDLSWYDFILKNNEFDRALCEFKKIID